MNIEEAAVEVGLTVEAVRDLAARGLVKPDEKTGGYDAWRLAQLSVAKRGQELGVDETALAALLSYFNTEAESSAAIEAAIARQTAALDEQADALAATRERLAEVAGAA